MSVDHVFIDELLAPLKASGILGLTQSMPDDTEFTMVNPNPDVASLPGSGPKDKAGMKASVQRMLDALTSQPEYEMRNVFVGKSANNTPSAVIEIRSHGKTKSGKVYDNTHCWVCEFDTQGAKPKVKRVRVYLDSAHALRMMSDK